MNSPVGTRHAIAALVAGIALTAALTAYAVRGHIVVALLAPVVLGLLIAAFILRERLARVRLRRLLVAGFIALPPLAVLGPALAVPGRAGLFGFRVVLAMSALLGLLWLLAARPRLRLEEPTYVALYAAWLAWLVITLAWAADRSAGLHYLTLFVSLGAVAAATASAGLTRRRLRYLLLGLAGVYGLSLLVATAEWTLRRHLPTASAAYAHRAIPAAFFYNSNDFTTYLALCWPFVLLLPALRRRASTYALCAVALLLCGAALLHTGSRLSLISIAFETLIVAAALAWRGTRTTRLVVIAGVLVVLLGSGLVLTGHGASLGIRSKFALASGVSQSATGQTDFGVRAELQKAGLEAAATRWFMGVGPGNAEVLVLRENPQLTVFNLHDWWLEVLVDGGLPALLIFATMYAMLLVSMSRVARRAGDPLLRYLGTATAIALAGFAIAIVDPSTAIKFPPMAILFGLALAVLIRIRREEGMRCPPEAA